MTSRFSLLLAALALGFNATAPRADDPKKDEPKKERAEAADDLKKMQGEWTSKDDQGESTWTFKDDRLSLKTPTRAYEITLKLDPKAKPTPTVDMKVTDKSPNAAGFTGLGIYKFDGDKSLQICFSGQDGTNRPSEFKTDFDKAQFSFDLKKK